MSPRALLYDPELRVARDLYDVLDDLLRGDPEGTFTAGQLAAVLGVGRTTVQRWAQLLERAGWLERLPQVGQHGGAGYRPLRRPRCRTGGTPGTREVSHQRDAWTGVQSTKERGREEAEDRAASPARWCGRCDSDGYRFVVDDDGRNPRRCPTCHPASTIPAPF